MSTKKSVIFCDKKDDKESGKKGDTENYKKGQKYDKKGKQ